MLNLSGKSVGVEQRLFWSSVLLLFGEILAIRWLGIEVPTMKVFPNLVLLVVLVGASAGMSNPEKYTTPPKFLILSLCILMGTVIFSVLLGIPSLSIKVGEASTAAVISAVVLLMALVLSLIALFVNVGGMMAAGFSALPPLRAYSINLLGSITGVVLVALISIFHLPPPVWILMCGLICWQSVRSKLVPIVTAVLIVAACATTLKSQWSPYSKLDVLPIETAADSALGKGNYVLNSNNHYFHFALRMLNDEEIERLSKEPETPQKGIVEHYHDFLHIPFACAPKHDRVLILGGGSGNDVAYALAQGAKHVDVVEIDPIISNLGKTIHPDKPYVDPRVTLHNEDARTFLRYSKDKFDLIEFSYLDPGSTVNSASFVRVDNFVYTVESIKSAISRLDNGGLLTISFATGSKHPVTRRLYQTINEAQGSPPRAYVDDAWTSVLYLAGPEANKLQLNPELMKGLKPWPNPGEDVSSKPATDDWPFLYLEFSTFGASLYFGVLLVSVILPALLLTRGKRDISSGAWGNMFFLGQAFMLVETKSITQLSLFFGATWLVSSVVIACVLTLAFFSNWCAGRVAREKMPFIYVGLLLALAVDYFFQVPTNTEIPQLGLAGIATLIGCLPIFFGGLIFSLCFREAKAPAQYLAANLLGVAVGGLTENLCLATGIKGLVLIAMGLYAMSFAALQFSAKKPSDSDQTPELPGEISS